MPKQARSCTVSIRDVAKLAGVSLGSASRVINNVKNVTPQTRARVAQAIAQLSYQPNHAAQSLRLHTTRTIGCMLTDVTNPLYGKLFHALEEQLRKAGYVVLLTNSLNDPEREIGILATFRARGVDGAIIAPGNERHKGVVEAVRDFGAPTVILDRDMSVERDRVQFDQARSIRVAVNYLVELGHRRVAMVLAQTHSRPMRRRVEGFRAGLRDHDIEVDEDLLVRLPSSMSSSFSAVSELLSRRERPTALLALGTNIVNEALSAIATRRLRIPADISVVSIGDPDFARNFVPPITAVRLDLERVAQKVTDLLLARIEHRDTALPRSVTVPFDFIIRESCGPAPR